MKQLDPKAKWLFFIQYTIGTFFSLFFTVCFFGFFAVGALSEVFEGSESGVFDSIGFIIALCCILPYIASIAFSYLWAQLSYNNYKYELTEDGFRKESGVLFKKYVTIPYERIQNVDIYRGIFARMLELSDLHIQTAGMSYSSSNPSGMTEGRLPGLNRETAEKLRDQLVKRARGVKHNDGV